MRDEFSQILDSAWEETVPGDAKLCLDDMKVASQSKQQSKVKMGGGKVGRWWYEMMTKTVQISTQSIYRFIEIFVEIRPCQYRPR